MAERIFNTQHALSNHEPTYWIHDNARYQAADKDSKLKHCSIVDAEGDVIFPFLADWGHAELVVAMLNALETPSFDGQGKRFIMPMGATSGLPILTDTNQTDDEVRRLGYVDSGSRLLGVKIWYDPNW